MDSEAAPASLRALADNLEKRKSFPEQLEISNEAFTVTVSTRKPKSETAHACMKWTPEKDEELASLYKEGRCKVEIAEIMGATPGAILTRLKRLGYQKPFQENGTQAWLKYKGSKTVLPPKFGKPYTEEEVALISDWFSQGKTVEEISALTERTVKGITLQLIKMNLIEKDKQ